MRYETSLLGKSLVVALGIPIPVALEAALLIRRYS
jgi:hypothetical protein